ncbi:MAG: hypothetical protein PUF79_01585 [Lactobacillaceae bacterium]|nr:hypothetical protein [Lactobacillaceae bacterium]
MAQKQSSTEKLINNLLTKIANLEWQNTQLQVKLEEKEEKKNGSN